ncbi:SAP domain-containing protein [Pediococcus acidilactici]|uniref:SAP domain-containing protein n=1 Tax=Pediococcus acidilactici TaxID=1254 RepID=UPI001E47D33B|nr:SAP domain-containing protein [Pediococcus acidilactici]WDA27066.1 SAP domain-containing protein [Pediococcus acidilactici]WQS12083.1 SAP domain-containing protein [Pediococcus acidilactici]
MDVKDFKKFIGINWYKTELQEICKKIRLQACGAKHKLTTYVEKFSNDEKVCNIKPTRKNNRRDVCL